MEVLREFSSELIASSALVFTAWQFSIQRKPVTPHLFSFTDRESNVGSGTLAVSIVNNGLGPAYIHKFEVYLDGNVSDPDTAVKAVLIKVSFPTGAGLGIKEMERNIERLKVVITYKSVYGTKYVLGGSDG